MPATRNFKSRSQEKRIRTMRGEKNPLDPGAPQVEDSAKEVRHLAERIAKHPMMCNQYYSEKWRTDKTEEILNEELVSIIAKHCPKGEGK